MLQRLPLRLVKWLADLTYLLHLDSLSERCHDEVYRRSGRHWTENGW